MVKHKKDTRLLVIIGVIAVLVAAGYVASAHWGIQFNTFFAAEPDREIIDTLPYFTGSHTNQTLLASADGANSQNSLSSRIIGNSLYVIKGALGATNRPFQYHTWDRNYIYLAQDSSGTTSSVYSINPGIWMKRSMAVGESIQNTAPQTSITYYDTSCQPTTTHAYNYTMTLERHDSHYDAGGDLGIQDVIVLRYQYGNGVGFERSFYSREWGWIRWESHPTGTETARKIVAWNRSSDATPPIPGTVCGLTDDAEFVSENIPRVLHAGQVVEGSVTMRNSGTSLWAQSSNFKLGSQGPQDNLIWGYPAARTPLRTDDLVAPGQTTTFTFKMKAPEVPGTYPFQMGMLREHYAWFGEKSPLQVITVIR